MSLSRRELFERTAGIAAALAAMPLEGCGLTRAEANPVDDSAPRTSPGPKTFFMSESGSDEQDGLSPDRAWTTIAKANRSLPLGESVLLFNRGDTFYGELALPYGCEIGAYGSGSMPILTKYKVLNRSEGWSEHATGIWRIDLGKPDSHDGYTATNDANIGFLVVDGVVRPALKFKLSEMRDPWDFCCDIETHSLYVNAAANPTTLASDIKAAPNGNSYGVSSAVVYCEKGGNKVHDVHITGSGGCGVLGSGPDVHIHDCLIDYIGGSLLVGHSAGATRYGNGIQNWPNVKRWTIENNELAHVYDVAWSPQGRNSRGDQIFWEDLTVRNNYIHDCGQSFEMWSQNTNSESPGFVRILVDGNLCERAGYGVFGDVRPDQNVRVHLLTYGLETEVDITIQNNIFNGAHSAYSYHAFDLPAGFKTQNNVIRLRAGQKLQYQRAETVEQAAAWQDATGRERGSTITLLA